MSAIAFAISKSEGIESRVSPEEWATRVELAALYRLTALHGYDDFLYTHISARIPGPDRHFLLNPFGLYFGEVTASNLVKIDLDGNVLQGDYGVNYAGFVIHSAIHAAREDALYVAHFHTDDGVAVSSQKEGLLPLNQRALALVPRLAYHDYEGVALNLDERARLVQDIGDKSLLLLRNHGTLALGPTAVRTWLGIWSLERAATAQIRTLSAGRENVLIAPEAAQAEVLRQTERLDDNFVRNHDRLAWAALLRRLDRELPGYDS